MLIENQINEQIARLVIAKNKITTKYKPKKALRVAIAGATGLVGKELISILDERDFPISSLKLLASENSVGEKMDFDQDEISVELLCPEAFDDIDLAFFALDNDLAKKYCEIAAQKGVVCIDKSSAFRADPNVPLVVPEVNASALGTLSDKKIIASPNCTTTPLVQVLHPLHQIAKIKRVVLSSYQAVSGAGKLGIEELDKQVRDLLNFREVSAPGFSRRIAFSVIPAIPASGVNSDGNSEEEQKVIDETRRILGLENLRVSATCVRVPVFNGHSEAVNIEFESAIDAKEARDTLANAPGIIVIDEMDKGFFPTPVDASGEDWTLVGRIRNDSSLDFGISLWLACDNLRTGAALNATRIAEVLYEEYLSS